MPIGMGELSSIIYEENVEIGNKIKKYEKVGYFAFDGSSFAIIFTDASKYLLVIFMTILWITFIIQRVCSHIQLLLEIK